jgi:hypothetical protein
MSNRAYRVGQVLYVLANKETKIYPVQVIEEIIKRTVAGESVSYLAKVGKSGRQVTLSEVDGELFENVENLREVLMKRVTSTISNVIENAVTKANEWYEQPEVHSPIIEQQDQQLEEKVVVRLPDGKIANLKI